MKTTNRDRENIRKLDGKTIEQLNGNQKRTLISLLKKRLVHIDDFTGIIVKNISDDINIISNIGI